MTATNGTGIDDLPPDLLKDHRVLVAGGAGNVGSVIVEHLLRAGATAIVPSRSAERLDALREDLRGGLLSDDLERLVAIEGDLAGRDGPSIRDEAGALDGVVASLGRFVPAPSVIEAPESGLEAALESYVLGHFRAARLFLPALEQRAGSYLFVNGPLAFQPMFAGAGLVSIASAAQAMLARVLMRELADGPVRVNELVLYTSFGRPDDAERNTAVRKDDVGRFVATLLSGRGAGVRGETIHLRSPDAAAKLLPHMAA